MRTQSQLPKSPRRTARRPAADPDAALLERLGRRLAAELRDLFDRLPPTARTVRAAAEYLGVDRNLCQRTFAAIRADHTGLEVLLALPLSNHVQRLVENAMRRVPGGRSSPARSSLEAMEQAISATGGTPIRFRRAVQALSAGPARPVESEGSAEARRRLHTCAVGVAGADLALRVHVAIVYPATPSAKKINVVYGTGVIGQEVRRGAMPFSWTPMVTNPDVFRGSVDDPPLAVPPIPTEPELLEPFCSDGLAITREFAHTHGAPHILDAGAIPDGARVDMVSALRAGPMLGPIPPSPDPSLTLSLMLRTPAQRLLMDVFVHRSIAARCLVSGGAFVWNPIITAPLSNPSACWHCELPGQPSMEMLGPGLRHVATSAWSRHEELVSNLFERCGWDVSQTVGYRLDVRYPIWGMIYCISLDGQTALAET